MAIQKARDDYLVGIITALPIERAAFIAMFDERHSTPVDFRPSPQDPNLYAWGSIAEHNIVMASLSAGVYGTTSAATTALSMAFAFPKVQWRLMVGIGAGVPRPGRDIRLGDVVVSQPMGGTSGVFQYDLGKLEQNGNWRRGDWLARPPEMLLKALGNLQAEHEFDGASQVRQHLYDALQKHPHWAKNYSHPGPELDRLFDAAYGHQNAQEDCSMCDEKKILQRPSRGSTDFEIHYGVIASGNSLVKSSKLRKKIADMEDQCICIEMEAGGLMNSWPCLIIRGICDYADSHKNDIWQRYASATAAAFAKELLTVTSCTGSSDQERTLTTVVKSQLENVEDVPKPEPHVMSSPIDTKPQSDIEADIFISTLKEMVESSKQPIKGMWNEINRQLRRSTDLNSMKFNRNETLLHRAAAANDPNLVNFLLENGAQPNARSWDGNTPLHCTFRVEVDLMKRFEMNISDRLGVAESLVDAGALIDSQDNNDNTPLHFAARDSYVECVRFLLDHGANPLLLNRLGDSPLSHARKTGRNRNVQLIEEYQQDPPTDTEQTRQSSPCSLDGYFTAQDD